MGAPVAGADLQASGYNLNDPPPIESPPPNRVL